jgi:lysophospholipase L1-like esterase
MTDHADGSSVPIIDELKKGDCGKVIILLGTNELGWPSYPTFIQRYSNLLDAVWERQPNARIYICGLPPVTKKTDDKNSNGINNANIRRMNGMLEELAGTRGASYIDLPAELYDSNNCLPAEASSDGIHLNLKYDRIWADHITLKVMGVI